MNKKRNQPGQVRRMRRRFVRKLLMLCIFVFLLRLFVIGVFPQHGNQMYPAVRDGDLVVTFQLTTQYHIGSVAVYRDRNGGLHLGRIVAVPGDTVSVSETGSLEINGLMQQESDPIASDSAQWTARLPVTVPADSYFILNDSRSETDDSRSYGAIPKQQLKGEVIWLFRRRGF